MILSEVATIVDCEHKTAPIDEAGEFFAVGTPAMKGNAINYSEARRISEETFRTWTRRMSPSTGDLLLAREAPVGPVVRIPDSNNVAPGQRTVLVRPLEAIDARFLYYCLASPETQARMLTMAAGSTVPHLNVEEIRKLELGTLPSLRAQESIAEVLGALDDKIAANHRLHRLAIDQISALARAAAGTVRLGEVASLHRNSLAPGSFGAENVWHYSLPSFDEGKVRLEASSGIMSAKHRLDRPVVLVSKLNPRIPRVWPVMRLKEGVSVTSPEFMAMAPTQGFSVASLTAALRSEQFTASLLSLVAGTTGSHQRVKPMEVMELGIPDMRTLSRAALETIEALELMSVSSSEENTALARTRDELLPLLMSGRITVKDAEKRVQEEV